MGDAALARVGRQRRVVMTMPVFSGVYRAVAQSDLIALLPTQLAHHAAREGAIEVYQPPMQIAAATIVMIWHRRNAVSPPHVWFRALIAEMLAPLDETG
jgi:DNA-binding transcriptional LysR family regulator